MSNSLFDLALDLAGDVIKAIADSPGSAPSSPGAPESFRAPKQSRFAGEDPRDRSHVQLTRGALSGFAYATEDGSWSFVISGITAGDLIIVPRTAGASSFVGDAKFDRRAMIVQGSPARVPKAVRSAWLASPLEWLYASGTLTTTVPKFDNRIHMFDRLDAGLDIAEALCAADDFSPAALRKRLEDSAWAVADAALDALALTPERDATLEQILADRSPSRGRLRVRAATIAHAWSTLERECKSLDSAVRSDAFTALIEHAPTTAANVAPTLLARMTALDDYRTAWLLDAFETPSEPITSIITPHVRERYLITLLAHAQSQFADAAGALLVRFGTATTLAALGPEHAELAAAIRARIQGGGLALAETDGGLTIAD